MTSTYDEDSQPHEMPPKSNDMLQKSRKLLRDVNQSTVFDKRQDRTEVAPRQTGSATLSSSMRRSLVDLSASRTLPKSTSYKPRGSKVGSDLSSAGDQRLLVMNAKLL